MTTVVAAFVVASVSTPLVIALVRRLNLYDVPNQRSSHVAPVPRGGGIAIAAATASGIAVANHWPAAVIGLLLGSLALAATGLLDDRLGLPAVARLLVQVVVPLAIALAVVDRGGWQMGASVMLAVFVLAGFVNAFNFMDGINGISGIQAAIVGTFLAIVAEHVNAEPLVGAGWAVCGAALGFLPFNAVRSFIFLGDVGSYFLGFWLAGLGLLVVDAGAPALVVLAPFLLYLLDTSVTLLRRARRRQPLMEAHREHTYQRLVQAGWSHLSVAVLCGVVSATCCVIMYAAVDSSSTVIAAALGGCLALVLAYLALPSLMQRYDASTSEARA
jgi:UDP-GlcNAc:undecaprenyl-phosphate/decaprenyl-phosphate GlcNAc-1-phosphate transferase